MMRDLDVRDEASAKTVVAEAVERIGRIDVVVDNAAASLFGAIEETTLDDARDLFETNVFGLLAVSKAVLPVLRAQRGGHLVMMSSMGGFCAGAGFGIYAATEFAVEAVAEALREEVGGIGIAVSLVEPGVFATDLGDTAPGPPTPISDYAEITDVSRYDDGEPPGDPAILVDRVRWLVEQPDPPLRLPVGADAFARITAKLHTVRAELDQLQRPT